MLHWLFAYGMTAAAAAACLFAIWKGGPAERGGGILIGGAWLVALVLFPLVTAAGSPYAPYVPFAVDGFVAVGLLGLALRYSSFWLGAAVFLQAAELALHAAFLTGDGLGGQVYIARVNILGSVLVLLLMAATLRVWLHRERADRQAIPGAGPKGSPAPRLNPAQTSAQGGDGFPRQAFDAAPVPVAHRLVRR